MNPARGLARAEFRTAPNSIPDATLAPVETPPLGQPKPENEITENDKQDLLAIAKILTNLEPLGVWYIQKFLPAYNHLQAQINQIEEEPKNMNTLLEARRNLNAIITSGQGELLALRDSIDNNPIKSNSDWWGTAIALAFKKNLYFKPQSDYHSEPDLDKKTKNFITRITNLRNRLNYQTRLLQTHRRTKK